MTLERFEKILRWKYDNGIHKFIGNVSGNHYEIYRVGNTTKKNNWCVKVNDRLINKNTNFFTVACAIYDTELEACL